MHIEPSGQPAPGRLVRMLVGQLVEDGEGDAASFGYPAGAFAAMAPHRLERGIEHGLDHILGCLPRLK